MRLLTAMLLTASMVAGNTWAHGGGLNKDGCHNNRKTGDYHCHRGCSPSSQVQQQRYQPANQLAPSGYAAPNGSRVGRAFANCAEARAAGAAPVRRGEPGYGTHLDRDNDGIGCEPYKGR